ncbi:MAG TPA: hypothetical protein VKB80_28470 [Kofleriaceae bacterium]|nr:hypothetical protein [Kofleriaceae bacterium]
MGRAARWSGIAVAAALLLSPRSALAEPRDALLAPAPAPPAGERPQADSPSYGGQIFAVDGILAAMALGSGSGEVLLGLGLTGPVIHTAHGHLGTGFASLGLRVGAPIAGAYAGAAICNSRGDSNEGYDCLSTAFLGFAVGAVVALGIDYFVLAR